MGVLRRPLQGLQEGVLALGGVILAEGAAWDQGRMDMEGLEDGVVQEVVEVLDKVLYLLGSGGGARDYLKDQLEEAVAMVEEGLGEVEEDTREFGHNDTGYKKAFQSACGVRLSMAEYMLSVGAMAIRQSNRGQSAGTLSSIKHNAYVRLHCIWLVRRDV
jgi:hypothetical protein